MQKAACALSLYDSMSFIISQNGKSRRYPAQSRSRSLIQNSFLAMRPFPENQLLSDSSLLPIPVPMQLLFTPVPCGAPLTGVPHFGQNALPSGSTAPHFLQNIFPPDSLLDQCRAECTSGEAAHGRSITLPCKTHQRLIFRYRNTRISSLDPDRSGSVP